jgi:uncharacterized protein (TIGR03435 family)
MTACLRALAFLLPVLGYPQALRPPKVAFEVSEVKVSAVGGTPNLEFLPDGKIVANFVTMKELIAAAWAKRDEYVTGGPSWLGEEHYDIVAQAPHDAKEEDLLPMLQRLLFDRFKLAAHLERIAMPVYVLSAATNGPKLSESTAPVSDAASCKMQLRTLTCKNAPIRMLVERLPAAYVDHPVVDQTELKGRYDFAQKWQSEAEGFIDAMAQLGLRLESRQVPMDVVVVDRVDRVPTEN